MTLTPGTRVGPYEIAGLVGEGGMGLVYRATDTSLRRPVAIKVLHPEFATDPDRVARLGREAQMLAAVNHPNIGGIHGLERLGAGHALVLEFVAGDTLADRLRRGPLPVVEVVDIARQIAAALEAAHDKGIVHRDLKPANVKITADGVVKVLDFGLAKAAGAAFGVKDTDATTNVGDLTRDGAIVGTVSYMSPEQARGQAVDKRTDIWAFGCVVYELLTRRRPFDGDTTVDTLAAIVEREPEWTRLPEDVPESLRNLLRRCLEKDARLRLRDIGEARVELSRAMGAAGPSPVRRGARSRAGWRWPAAAAVVAALAALALRQTVSSPAGPEPPVQLTDFNDSVVMPSLSPDGRILAFVRGPDFGRTAPPGRVYVKLLPDGEPMELTEGTSAGYPTFSPDGSRIVYTSAPNGNWDSWEVPVLGGAPQLFLTNASGLSWLNDGRLVYSEIKPGGMHMGIVASAPDRSAAREVYFPDSEAGMAHRTVPSPDSRSLLVVEMLRGVMQPCRLLPADGSSPGRPVGPSRGLCTSAAWSPDGRWMYFSSNAGGAFHVWRQRYPDGTPEQITFGPTQQEGTAITPDGRYLITSMGLERATIMLHDSSDERALTEEGFVTWPSMDPSGTRLYYLMRAEGSQGQSSGELWTTTLDTRRRQRLFPDMLLSQYALSTDGRRVVFITSGHPSGDGIWIADLDRSRAPQQLTGAREAQAFFGAEGEIVYLGADNRLRRMRDDGSAAEVVSADPVLSLMSVSPDGRWAAVIAPMAGDSGRTRVEFRSLRGEPSFVACDTQCRGFGPASVRYTLPYMWTPDGTRLIVNLGFLDNTARVSILPYRPGVPLEKLWPAGLGSAQAIAANPGARTIEARGYFPAADPNAYLSWRASFQSNLYRLRLPE